MDEFAQSLEFWRKPDQVRSGGLHIPKGKLMLAPCLPVGNISTKPGGQPLGSYTVGDTSMKFWGLPPTKPHGAEVTENIIMSVFWWVATTADKENANMELYERYEGDIKVPLLRNRVAIAPYSKLLKFQAAAPAKSSSLKIETAPAKKPEQEKPAKKPRKS